MKNEEFLSFHDFYGVIAKRKKFISVFVILTTVIVTIINFCIISPIYEAKTISIISKNKQKIDKYDDVLMYQNLVKTYSEIAKSDIVVSKAITELSNSHSHKFIMNDIKESIKVKLIAGTSILDVTVQRKDPEETIDIINALMSAFIEESGRLVPSGKINVMDEAIFPEEPITPNKLLNVIIAFLLGLVVSVGMVFVIEYLDDTIKKQADVEKYLGLRVMGIIPKN